MVRKLKGTIMKKTRDKKIRIFPIGKILALFLVTVMSFYFLSSTLAKYTNSATATDMARIASWGVTITATYDGGDNVFGEDYANGVPTLETNLNLDASSSNGDKIIAPGTENTFVITITGSPEVSVRIDFDSALSKLRGTWEVDGEKYQPVVWTVNEKLGGNDAETLLEKGSLADLKALFNGLTGQIFAPNTVLDREYEIKWEWPIELGDTEEEILANNDKDTALTAIGNTPGIKFNLVTTVVQTDNIIAKVSYSAGDGSGTVTDRASYPAGTVITLDNAGGLTAPEGESFLGWRLGTTVYKAGASYTVPLAEVNFIAVFGSDTAWTAAMTKEYSASNAFNIPNIYSKYGTDYKITEIGESAFADNTAITSIAVPDGVTSIGSGAFSGCTALTSITLPTSLTDIDENAFDGCALLATVNYKGSSTDWSAVTVSGTGNSSLTSATYVYNYIG